MKGKGKTKSPMPSFIKTDFQIRQFKEIGGRQAKHRFSSPFGIARKKREFKRRRRIRRFRKSKRKQRGLFR